MIAVFAKTFYRIYTRALDEKERFRITDAKRREFFNIII